MKNNKLIPKALLSVLLLALLITCGGCKKIDAIFFKFEPLEFPITNPADIEHLAAFGIPNWSDTEPHNGIDLVLKPTLVSTQIVSPTNGTISSIKISENPYSNPRNQLLMTVKIFINFKWSLSLVLEPSTTDTALKDAQRAAIKVKVGQVISTGDVITDLLVGDLGYPHLHFMLTENGKEVCPYSNSSDAAKRIFETIVSRGINNNLPDGNICYGEGK